jgi:hypothetical protein
MYLTKEQELEVPQSIPTLRNGSFGPQNFAIPLEHRKNNFFSNFEPYDLANKME